VAVEPEPRRPVEPTILNDVLVDASISIGSRARSMPACASSFDSCWNNGELLLRDQGEPPESERHENGGAA
jgi:hypothetical protein